MGGVDFDFRYPQVLTFHCSKEGLIDQDPESFNKPSCEPVKE